MSSIDKLREIQNCVASRNSRSLPSAIDIMVFLRRELTKDLSINSESTWGRSSDPSQNPTIAKIATDIFNGWRMRFIQWHLDRLLTSNELSEDKVSYDGSEDMLKAKVQFDQCFELMKSRNAKYWDSRKRLSNSSIVDLMIMKLDRCQKQKLDDKALEVEIEDVVNYGIFALINIRNQ